MIRRLAVALALAFAPAAAAQTARSYEFEGAARFTSAQLLRALNAYHIPLDPPIEATTADDAAFFLREFLFQQGLSEADVSYAFAGDRVVFTISEGPRHRLGAIRFAPGGPLTTERMAAIVNGEIRRQTHTPFGSLPFVAGAVDAGAERVRTTLVSDGFLDATVTAAPAPASELGIVDVDFTVDPGKQYVIESVTVRGATVTDEARASAEKFASAIYHPGDEALSRAGVLDTLRRQGFFKAEVAKETTFDPAKGTVRIDLDVSSGPRFTLGKITIEGNGHTQTSAILRRLSLKPGTTYNASAVDEGVRRLWFSGAFADVDEKQSPTAGNSVDLHIKLSEAPARQLSTTIGYGQWDRAFGEMTFTDRNFFGTLNRFSLRGFISQRSYGIESSLSDPWFLQTEMIATASAFYIRQELPAFKATQYGGTLSIERRFSQNDLTGWRASYQWKAVTNSTVYADESLEDVPVNYTLGQLAFRQVLDRRNDLLSPMKGYFLSWEPGVASRVLGGEISFFRLNVQATGYVPLRKITAEDPFVPFLVFNHRAGLMVPYGDTSKVPVQERFFLGGPDTVRSFQLDGLGPRDKDGNPEGGLAYLLGNAEIQWPLFKALYIAAFVDAGNLSPTLEDFAWDNTRIGVGLGARVYTPLGAVRVDYGYNLIRRDGDPLGAWQFGFGFTF